MEPTAVQLTWGELPAGTIEATAHADRRPVSVARLDHPGGPGVLDVHHLTPDTHHSIEVTIDGMTVELEATTPRTPPGAELFRFATVSDLHLGSDHFGVFRQMFDRSEHPDPFALRSARSALRAAAAWGAEHVVIKGDAAHHGTDADFGLIGRLVDEHHELSLSLLPGNHDVDQKERPLPTTVGRRRLGFVRSVEHLDRDGLRIVLGDTTIAGAGVGTLRRIGDELVERAADSDRAAAIIVHQQLQQTDPVRHYPPGIPGREARSFLDRLTAAAPDAIVTSGHTHRNRARRHGPVLVTEVAATHHWPGVWAGYAVHEGGIRQVVRRIGGDSIGWHEYSKNAVLGIWQRYAAGTLDQRCINHHWRRRS